jgi:hypothetical protein
MERVRSQRPQSFNQLHIGQAKTRSGTRHFPIGTIPRMTRYRLSHLLLLKVTEQFLVQLPK